MERVVIPIEGRALDMKRTLRPLHGHFADDGWWFATRTPFGPGTLRLRRTHDELVGEAWGEGSGWLLDRLGPIAGLDDDPASFLPDHPLVAELQRRHPGYRFGRTGLVFRELVISICAQKVTGTEATRAMRGLRKAFSEPAPGPNRSLLLPPDPERMATAPYHAYHSLHLEKRRADTLREVSKNFDRIEALATSDPGTASRVLMSFRGIGVWSAAKTLAVSHGDPDQVAAGDFHFSHIVAHHLTGRDRGTDTEMLELLEPFRPQRGRVIRLLSTLGSEPKFGPRMTPRNITRS